MNACGSSIEYGVDEKPRSIGILSSKSESDIIYSYIDSLYKYFPKHDVPEKFKSKVGHYHDSLYHLDLGYFYFSEDPEEIHEVQFSGMIYHKALYKVHNNDLTKIHGEGIENLGETERVLKRIEEEIFPKIELLIEQDSLTKANLEMSLELENVDSSFLMNYKTAELYVSSNIRGLSTRVNQEGHPLVFKNARYFVQETDTINEFVIAEVVVSQLPVESINESKFIRSVHLVTKDFNENVVDEKLIGLSSIEMGVTNMYTSKIDGDSIICVENSSWVAANGAKLKKCDTTIYKIAFNGRILAQ